MSGRIPAEVFPPGEFIRDELEARGWTQTDLAEILGRPFRLVNEILSGKRAITPETAAGLGSAFGVDPQLWLNLEGAYRLSLVKPAGDDVERRALIYSKAPIKEMMKRRWIESTSDVSILEREYLRFFEVASIDETPTLAAVARKSTDYAEITPGQLTWLFRVKQLAASIDVAPFDEARLADLFPALRRLTSREQGAGRVPRLLAEYGIKFLVVEPLSKTKIDGAALWIDGWPVIALSFRFDRIDWFWHTLAHEIAHIHYKDSSRLDDDLNAAESEASTVRPEAEVRADRFACDLLVPSVEMESFIARVRPQFSKVRIVQFANRIQVHPGIITGQLQRRDEINYSQGRDMLVRVRDVVKQSALTDGWETLKLTP